MSDSNQTPRSLEELTREAKSSLKPASIDWEKVEDGLFARIEAKREGDDSGVRESTTSRLRHLADAPDRRWQIAGLVAAAAVMVLALHKNEANVPSVRSTAAHAGTEDVLTLTKNTADVRIDGEIASPGRTLHVLDTIETTTATAELAANDAPPNGVDDPGALRVAWQLGDHSTVAVKSLGGGTAPFVLDLAAGSVEAQVTPVERGEAFAVDLRSPHANGPHDVVRIAVHGTHLRVARDASGDHATIDLTEGVVSIGFPPKIGSTYGTLVTAPAHVDLDVTKLLSTGDLASGAIVVDKNEAAVRAPIALASRDDHATAKLPDVPAPETTDAPESANDHPEVGKPAAAIEKTPAPSDPHATEAIRAAAQSCAAVHASTEVKVSVTSKLTVHVGPDGLVKMAKFDPPLSPEAQDCAAKTIYRTHFATASSARDVSVDVDVNP
ncbi:MAG TPA: hypothetical protein VF407_02420 [Polyangiaceae bacterium]